MDCVVSGRTGKGGLLERSTRHALILPLCAISRRTVHRAHRRLITEDALRTIHTMTTDNGCECLDQPTLEKILHASVYYTHAYTSWEKGSVEHANGLLRFRFPKDTDFSNVSQKYLTHI